MKKLLVLLVFTAFLSCKNDDDTQVRDNNPFLNPPIVNLRLNLNLPEYNALRFPGNSVILPSQGVRGIVVYNVNNDLYTAFDLSDPNHIPNNCSRMEIEGIVATCPCEDHDNSYDIVTGQHQNNPQSLPMLQYRITKSGDNLSLTNL